MKSTLIVLIGCRAAGKSTLQERAAKWRDTLVLRPSTARPARAGETDEYDFVTGTWPEQAMAWSIDIGRYKYGMRKDQLIRLGQEMGITVFDPGNIGELERYRNQHTNDLEIVTVGLNTLPSVTEQARRVGIDSDRLQSEKEFSQQLEVVERCDLVLSGDPEVVELGLRTGINVLVSRGGLIDHDSIHGFLAAGTLLKDAKRSDVQSASYDLRLGDRALCMGQPVTLTADHPVLSIPPYSFAWVMAKEKAHFPKFIAGRFDIRIKFFLQGVILSNGPQVDPGYRGALLCMLFNGNDVAVELQRDEHFATIEFHTTCRRTPGYSGPYQDQEAFEKFFPSSSYVSPGGRIGVRVTDIDKRLRRVERNIWAATTSTIAALAILMAVGLAFVPWIWNERSEANKVLIEMAKIKEETKTTNADVRADAKTTTLDIRKELEELREERRKAADAIKELRQKYRLK